MNDLEVGQETEALKVLIHVNDMARRNRDVFEIQMYLYNNWAAKVRPDAVVDSYEGGK